MMTHSMRKMLSAAALAAGIVTGLTNDAAEGAKPDAGFQYPELRVAKFAAAPVIDGKIGASEWAGAAAFTGVAAVGAGVGPYTMVPQVQQVVWRIGYDNDTIYLAMHSPHPKGSFPVVKVKTPDDSYPMLWDDHTEIQFCSHDPKLANTPPYGFFKIMTNAKDVVADAHYNNGTPGTEDRWDYGGTVKSLVSDEAWDMEMAIPRRNLKVEKLDGRTLTVQLVRTDSCGGIYFAGWVPEAWRSWGAFARVTFDPAAPVFAFEKLGEIMAGELDAEVRLEAGKSPRDINVAVKIEDADGKTAYTETKTAALKAGEKTALNWKAAALPVSAVDVSEKRRNHFEITASYKNGSENVVLYHIRLPFMKFNDEFRSKFLDPWIKLRPKGGEWLARVANLPYAGKLELSVDLDFFGLDPKAQNAPRFSVAVRAKGGGKELAAASGEIHDLKSKTELLDLPELPDGDYEAVFTLLGADGKAVAEQIKTFTRKRYPWEGNKLGISEEVIPPYLPIKTDAEKRTLNVWGRTLTLDKSGLVGQAVIGAPTGTFGGPEPLLSKAMRLEAVIDGKTVAGEGLELSFTSVKPDRVEFVGKTKLGALTATLKGFLEYDGWYQAQIAFDGAAAVDSLDLVIELRDAPAAAGKPASPIDTLYVQRQGGARYGNCLMGIPEKPGVHFRSTELLKIGRSTSGGKEWKSFVPNVLVGNGDRALQFHAWSDLGWKTSDDDAAVTVERLADRTVRERIRFIAGKTEMKDRQPVSFAFQFLPVKPNHPRCRTIRGEGGFYHDSSGWRYYGDSTDGYALNNDADYDALRRFLLYGPVGMGQQGKSEKKYDPGHNLERHRAIRDGSNIIMYGSTVLTGTGMEEFKSFGGEWLGDNNWKPQRQGATNAGWWNYGGTIQWNSDEQLSLATVNWTKSMTDNYLWYHKPLMEKCGFNGTWWDDNQLWTIREFDPATGKVEEKWNMLQRRELTKRLNVLGWQLMRPPAWIQHAHTDYAWTQQFWMVEGDYYADNQDMTALDQMPMDQWRAMTRSRTTMLVPVASLRGYEGSTPAFDRKVKRSVIGVCLSHDVMAGAVDEKTWTSTFAETKRLLTYAVNMPDTENCLFRGYWRTADAIQPAGKEIYASIYHNAKSKSAVVVLLNGLKGKDQSLGGTTFDPAALTGAKNAVNVKRLYDLESGKDIAFSVDKGVYTIVDQLFVPWHDYRLIALEVE
jgi:hypothetical protein